LTQQLMTSVAHNRDSSKDKVILEGWWKKSNQKGYHDLKKGSNRYFVLTERFLDWYKKPGEPRQNSLGLDTLYLRMHTDNVSIIVGDLVHGGKEFRLSSEAGDAKARAKEWYDKITHTIDVYKDMKRAGFSKKTEIEGKKSTLPDRAEPEKREVVTEVKKEEEKPAIIVPAPAVATSVTVEHKGNTTITEVSHSSPAPPAPKVDLINPYAAAATATFVAPPTPTAFGAFPPATATVSYTSPPVATFNTFAPSPITTVYSGFGPTIIQTPGFVGHAPVQCRFCARIFQPPPAPMFACPFCNQLNQVMPQTTVTTFAAPVFY